jgi:carboxypeptidase family protein
VTARQSVVSALLGALSLSCGTARLIKPIPQASCEPARTAGTLTVRVVDPSGLPLPGATVTLSQPPETIEERLMANAEGLAVFQKLPSNERCNVRIELPGFETSVAKQIPCSRSCNTSVEVPMRVDMRNAITFTRANGMPDGNASRNEEI